jgi:hypothetical protein
VAVRLIYDRTPELVRWAEARIPDARFRDDAVAIGIERNFSVVGAAIFDTFASSSCLAHFASDGSRTWLREPHAVIPPILAYPFVQCRFRRLTAVVTVNNVRSLRLARRLGFKDEGVMRCASPRGADVVVLGMLREDCWALPLHEADKVKP